MELASKLGRVDNWRPGTVGLSRIHDIPILYEPTGKRGKVTFRQLRGGRS